MVCQINSSCCMVMEVVVGVGRVTKVVFLDGQPNLLSIQRELCNQTDQSRNPINLSKITFHLNKPPKLNSNHNCTHQVLFDCATMASHTVYREVQFAHKNAEVSYIVNDDEESNGTPS